MNLKETIEKLKEVIFVKKGVGQPCKVEEEAVKSMEEQLQKQDAERKADLEKIEQIGEKIAGLKAKAHEFQEKLADAVRDWQAAAMELHRVECEAEDLFEDRNWLKVKKGDKADRGLPFPRSIFTQNPLNENPRWVADCFDPLSEEFKGKLLIDNREYYKKIRGGSERRKHIRKPEPEFFPQQAEAMILNDIPLPPWMKERYDQYKQEQTANNQG